MGWKPTESLIREGKRFKATASKKVKLDRPNKKKHAAIVAEVLSGHNWPLDTPDNTIALLTTFE